MAEDRASLREPARPGADSEAAAVPFAFSVTKLTADDAGSYWPDPDAAANPRDAGYARQVSTAWL